MSEADIVEAALEIGLDKATIRLVAERLGVTPPGLYYHVKTRDELLRLAMSYAIDTLYASFPGAANESFPDALRRFAEGLFQWLGRYPSAVTQIAEGRIRAASIGYHLEKLLVVAEADGYQRDRALAIINQVTAAVIGAAVLQSWQLTHDPDAGLIAELDHLDASRSLIEALCQG